MALRQGFYIGALGLALTSLWPLSACAITPSFPPAEESSQGENGESGDRQGTYLAQASKTSIFMADQESGKIDGQVSQGQLTAILKHTKVTQDGYESWTPTVTVQWQGQTVAVVEGTEAMFPTALIQIAPMDAVNPQPAVIFATYTGGAHCCNEVKIITSQAQGQDWSVVDLGLFNGGPHEAADLDGDGWYEYAEIDNRFLYRFSSYAGSAAPAQILALQNGEVMDVSFEPRFQFIHRENAQSMEKELPEIMGQDWEKNGFLAAYVANKALIGELDDGWQTMLKYYDRESDWGLTTCLEYDDQSNCLNEVKYDSYPDALRAFLVETGYIEADFRADNSTF
ncbi:hypothetical protein [Synechocystis salina]|uniref:hypothetical protein n=1 Tax=Synechocystis salina TaxID=945780 RepID=UPI001D156E8D|nr:hypothetical protein [Synechocystis salina]